MKKVAIALALCMVLSTLIAGVAFAGKAGAQNLPLYPVPSGDSDYPNTEAIPQGRVIVNEPMGAVALIIQGNAAGLLSTHLYTVWVRNLDENGENGGYTGDYINKYAPLGYYLLSCFTTNRQGKGHFHLNIRATDLPTGTYNIQVAINDPPGDPSNPLPFGPTVLATPAPPDWITVTVGS